MRMTQIYGLKEEAVEFLKENVEMIPNMVCTDCGKVMSYKQNRKVYDDAKDAGMFGDGPALCEYGLKDRTIVREKLNKYTPWSSGPNLFIDLVDQNGNILYGWSEEEINKSI